MLAMKWTCVQYVYSDIWAAEMQKIRWFFLILAVVVVLLVILQNNETTKIALLWFTQELPLSVLLLSTTAIGFLFGAWTTASMLRRHRKAKEAAAKKTEPPTESPKGNQSPLNPAAAE